MSEEEDEIADYLDEARGYIDELNEKLLRIEENPAMVDEDPSIIKDTFRAAHSLKGLSAAFGFGRTNELIHKVEQVLDEVRHGVIRIRAEMMQHFYQAMDRIDQLFAEIQQTGSEQSGVEEMLRQLGGMLEQEKARQKLEAPAEAEKEPAAQTQGPAAQQTQATVTETVRVGMDRLDRLMNLAGELVIARSRIMTLSEDLHGLPSIDGLDVRAVALEEVERIVSSMSGAVSDLEMVTNGIQSTVMEVRMVSLDPVFRRFQRTVRDVANQLDKRIQLVLEGTDTELDKRVTDELVNPLTHLVRNAADHGLESPEERRAAGKPEVGTITLRGEQRGNHVLIEVSDDGRGMDPARLRQLAIERGVLTREEAGLLSDAEALRLIFRPGFSTAREVTDISGRGMGMDIVMAEIENLRGKVLIESTPGEGSKLIIRLPLTLSILTCLLVGVGGEIYAIPLSSIQELTAVSEVDLNSVVEQDMIVVRDEPVPLIRLSDVLRYRSQLITGKDEASPRPAAKKDLQVVIVHTGDEGRVGVVVDELLRKEDLVAKPLSGEMQVSGLSGTAILGDGRVTLIVDPGTLSYARAVPVLA